MMTKTNPDNTTSEHAKRFVVYGREECHLCQNMILALKNLQEQVSFDFQVIDIDSNPELVALYGEKFGFSIPDKSSGTGNLSLFS